jgi:hypothetical protein
MPTLGMDVQKGKSDARTDENGRPPSATEFVVDGIQQIEVRLWALVLSAFMPRQHILLANALSVADHDHRDIARVDVADHVVPGDVDQVRRG